MSLFSNVKNCFGIFAKPSVPQETRVPAAATDQTRRPSGLPVSSGNPRNSRGAAFHAELLRKIGKPRPVDVMSTIPGGETGSLEAATTAPLAPPVLTAPPSKKTPTARMSIPLTRSRLELVGSSHGFFRTKMRVRPDWAGKKDFAELTAYVFGNKKLSQAERNERLQIAIKIVDCQTNPNSTGELAIACFHNVTELPVIPANVRKLSVSNMDNLEETPVIAESKTGAAPALRDYTIEHCAKVCETPDISKYPNLKALKLDNCGKLTEIPHVGSESRLEYLQMSNCGELEKPKKKFAGNHLEKVLIDHEGDYLTDKQMRKLDYCDDLPYVMDNIFSIQKTPPEDRDPPQAAIDKTSDSPQEWRIFAEFECKET